MKRKAICKTFRTLTKVIGDAARECKSVFGFLSVVMLLHVYDEQEVTFGTDGAQLGSSHMLLW
jgi:hypothetical protein